MSQTIKTIQSAELERGISAAKAGNKSLARQRLLRAVEIEPETEACWLWLAIVAASMEEQIGYLQQALAINPTNQRTIAALKQLEGKVGHQEIEVTEPAAKADVPTAVSSPCPICTASVLEKVDVCPSCGAVLRLDDITAVLDHPISHPKKLKKSILRLRKDADAGGDRAEILYNMGLAYLNLHVVKTAVTCLRASSRLRPDDLILKEQLAALVAYQNKEAVPPPPKKEAPIPPPVVAQAKTKPSMKTAVAPKPTKPPAPPVKKALPSRGTIMIVDDSNTIRKLVSMTLKRERYNIIVAVDGMDALSKLNEETPDLILLDITMPRMDGYQVCKVVKGNTETKHIPIVMLSGKDGFFDKVRGRVAGATDYITKPFDPQELVQTVNRQMKSRA